MANTFEIVLDRNRTEDYEIKLYQRDGVTPEPLAAADVVRIKLGRLNATPALEVTSKAATALGSIASFTPTTNVVNLRLAQGDTALLTMGQYTMEVGVAVDAETNPAKAFKPVLNGVAHVIGSLGGPIGI